MRLSEMRFVYGQLGHLMAGMILVAMGLRGRHRQHHCAPIFGGLSDKFGRKPFLLLGIAGITIPYAILATSSSRLAVYLFFAAETAGSAMGGSAWLNLIYAYVADVTPESNRAAAFGAISGTTAFGFLAGPLVARFVPPAFTFHVATLLCLCGWTYILCMVPESVPSHASCARQHRWQTRSTAPRLLLLLLGLTASILTASILTARILTARILTARVLTARIQTARIQTARVQTAGIQTAGIQTAGIRTARLRTARIRTARIQTARIQSARVQTAGTQTAGIQTAGIRTARLRTTRIRTAE
ncbi:hypothetical protein CLOP_g12440 [Closterium sp. NIES-67]|nr:hypothetical protein CLOP_g12440 [Closterium sp. NIES-67]